MSDNEEVKKSGFEVWVGGSKLTDRPLDQVKSVRVDMVADGPDIFEIIINTEDEAEMAYPNDDYKMAAEIELKVGFGDNIETLFKGEISRIDATFHEQDPPTFRISGFDRLHRLTRGRFTQHWEQVKYSDVANDIASKTGLTPDIESTEITFDYISMNNQTYLDFLSELARRVSYELNVDDKKLVFKSERSDQSSVATLTYGDNLKRAKFSAQTSGQMTKVRVLAWDDAQKQQVIGEAQGGDVSPMLGGSTSGPDVAKDAFSIDADFWVSNYAARTQSEVDEVAKSIMNEIAHKFVRVEAECGGDTAIKAGSVVTFDGCTGHFNGDYYVVRATHIYEIGSGPGKGYRTRLICSRPAWSV